MHLRETYGESLERDNLKGNYKDYKIVLYISQHGVNIYACSFKYLCR